ncbi:MAG: type II CAAX endopeptidase family protein [Kiritimatiellae bacterium]|jgi:membrane protease YdiL (CAAX protease family)|nr:type II CAAX endopeptidase family protein [Kiritimatiellia bacterium]
MPEWIRLDMLFGILLLSGVCFWVSLLFSPGAGFAWRNGWGWLKWRPLPHDLPKSFLWGFLLTFLLQIGVGVWMHPRMDVLPVGVVILISITVFQGLLSLILFIHLQVVGLNTLEVLGMESPLQVRDTVWGLMAYCMALPLVALSTLFTKALFGSLEIDLTLQPMIQQLSELSGWMNWFSLFLLIGFIGPLLEEFIFRGVLFPWLVQKTGALPGLLLQAAIFALIHQHAASLLALFSLAILLGLCFMYTRRLMTCVWAHAFFNSMTLVYTLVEGVEGGGI